MYQLVASGFSRKDVAVAEKLTTVASFRLKAEATNAINS
jgi:hypothetical protein